jgi:hypothetical protein
MRQWGRTVQVGGRKEKGRGIRMQENHVLNHQCHALLPHSRNRAQRLETGERAIQGGGGLTHQGGGLRDRGSV